MKEVINLILKQIREQRGWTHAQKLGVSKRFYQNIEAGDRRPSYEKLNQLEDLFEIPQRVLLAKNVEEIPNYYHDYRHGTENHCL